MRKIDIHCHTTSRPLPHTVAPDATLDAIRKEMSWHDIWTTVVLASYFPRNNKGSGVSNFRLRNWIDKRGRLENKAGTRGTPLVMFGSLDFERYFYQGMNELEELAESRDIVGVKIYTGYQVIPPDDLETVIKLCAHKNLPIMFHTGDCARSETRAFARFQELDKFVETYDKVNFIYTHLGNPHISDVMERVKRYKNLFTDMSGLIHSGKDDHEIPECIESVKRFYGECGAGQLMFGTDFPVQTHDHSVLIAEKGLQSAHPSDLQDFYYGNAARLLFQ